LEKPAIALTFHKPLSLHTDCAVFGPRIAQSGSAPPRDVRGKEGTLTSTNETLKVVALEDGSSAVVKVDPANPRLLEVVATFFDAARAHQYAKLTEDQNSEPVVRLSEPEAPAAPKAAPKEKKAQRTEAASDLSARQNAVLNALRAQMDENKQVEAKAATLAEAAQIPLGSLHSVLGSLEKKRLIVNTRPGSPRAPAVYQVL
jgi:uncharacterized membrane protein